MVEDKAEAHLGLKGKGLYGLEELNRGEFLWKLASCDSRWWSLRSSTYGSILCLVDLRAVRLGLVGMA